MIIFFYGSDTFRSKEKLNNLKNRFIKEVDKSGLNLVELEGEKININNFNKAILTQSFLAKKRMVIIKNIFKKPKSLQMEILKILKQKKFIDVNQSSSKIDRDNNILIFWEEKPDKRSVLFKYLSTTKFKEEFNILTNNNLTKWLMKRVREKGGKINQRNANLLASMSDGNLWILSNEIDKLIALKGGQEIIIKDIEKTSLVKINDNIFNLTDAIANNRKKQALKLINDQFEAGLNEFYILTMIVRQFRILIQIKSRDILTPRSYKDIARELGMHPFVVQKAIPQANLYSMEKLKKIYAELLDIDIKLKTRKLPAKTLLELFIMWI